MKKEIELTDKEMIEAKKKVVEEGFDLISGKKEFNLSEKICKKIVMCFNLQVRLGKLGKEIEEYLIEKGVNMQSLRNDDKSFVDMVDYGHGFCSKEELEEMFGDYKLKK